MSESKTGQVSSNAAEIYEEFFIPAIFGEWAERVINAAQIRQGQKILDVACGTGIVARSAAETVGAEGEVTGLDINEGMLAVAERKAPEINWQKGNVEAIPFENESFDAVVCQFALMFFEDRIAAIQEMMRVLKSDGKLAVAVWDSLKNTPGYAKMVKILERLFGNEAADGLKMPFVLGDVQKLKSLFTEAQVNDFEISTIVGKARFPSIESWVYTDIKGWTLADMIDDVQFKQLLAAAEKELQSFVTTQGTVEFDSPAHIITATKV